MIDQGFTSDTSEFLTEIQVPLKPLLSEQTQGRRQIRRLPFFAVTSN